MSAQTICYVDNLSPEERRRQVAAILVIGIERYRNAALFATSLKLRDSRDRGLEFVSEMPLSVFNGSTDRLRSPERDVFNGGNA